VSSQGLPVVAGETATGTLRRNEPLANSLSVRLGSSSGAELGPGALIAPNQVVWIGVSVLNSTTFSQTNTVQVVLKRDSDSSWLINTGESAPEQFLGRERTVRVLVTPTETGRYLVALQVRTAVYVGYAKTDAWTGLSVSRCLQLYPQGASMPGWRT